MKKHFSVIVLLAVFSFAPLAIAQTQPAPGPSQTSGSGTQAAQGTSQTQNSVRGESVSLINPLGSASLADFVNSILRIITERIGPIIVIFMLVYCGFLFVVAQGAEEKLRDARRMLMWTLIGALVLLGAQAISLAIQATVSSISGT